MTRSLVRLWHDEDAVTTVEYALLLTTIVAASIGAWTALGESIRNTVTRTAGHIDVGGQ